MLESSIIPFKKIEEEISPIKTFKESDFNMRKYSKFDFNCEIYPNKNKEEEGMKKREKCLKTLETIKKKLKKNSLNHSNNLDIQLHSVLQDSKLENKKYIDGKIKKIQEKKEIKRDENYKKNKLINFSIDNENTNDENNINNLTNNKLETNNFILKKSNEIIPKINSKKNIFNISFKERDRILDISRNNKNLNQIYKINNSNSLYYRPTILNNKNSNNDIIKSIKEINSSKILNSFNQDSTTINSSNIRKVLIDSNSKNTSKKFTISNIKSQTNNLNTFNNISVSDFTSKISNEVFNSENTINIINNMKFVSNKNDKEEDISNFIVNENSFNEKIAINLPKGFHKTNVVNLNKKIMPIKLRNFNELKYEKKYNTSNNLEKLQINQNEKLNLKGSFIENEVGNKKEKFEKLDIISSLEKIKTLNNTQIELKNETNINITKNNTLSNNYNKSNSVNSEISQNRDKVEYLESLYNKIANKNFSNLRRELDDYIDLFYDGNMKNEINHILKTK